jgi:hypothetical protein
MSMVTWRSATRLLVTLGIGVVLLSAPAAARVFDGFLVGTFIVRCPNGHDDQVEDITRNHDCEWCGAKAVDGGRARVVCPDGHATHVEGITRQHKCTQPLPGGGECAKQCRRS